MIFGQDLDGRHVHVELVHMVLGEVTDPETTIHVAETEGGVQISEQDLEKGGFTLKADTI